MMRAAGMAAILILTALPFVGCYCPICFHEMKVDKQVNPKEKWPYGGLKPPGSSLASAAGIDATWEIESGRYEVWGWVMPDSWPAGKRYPDRIQVYVDRMKDAVATTRGGAGSVMVTLRLDRNTGISLPDQYVQVPKDIVVDPAKNEYLRGQLQPFGAPLYEGADLKLGFQREDSDAIFQTAGSDPLHCAFLRNPSGNPDVFMAVVKFEKQLARALLHEVGLSSLSRYRSELLVEAMVYIFNIGLYWPMPMDEGNSAGGTTYPNKLVIVLECVPPASSHTVGPDAVRKLTLTVPIDPRTGQATDVEVVVAKDFAIDFSTGERLRVWMKPMGAAIPAGASMWICVNRPAPRAKPAFELFRLR